VTLSTAGLALIEAEAALGADPLRLTVPRARIDDVLKSLRIDDPAGAVARLALPGPGAFEDAFAEPALRARRRVGPGAAACRADRRAAGRSSGAARSGRASAWA
jgi:hypothetical protein